MLTIAIAVLSGIVGSGVVFGAGYGINKASKKRKAKKISKTFKQETLPELQNRAILALARHCGIIGAREFVELNKFDYSEELHKTMLINQHANEKTVSDKKIDKTFKVK